jgi:hypothetical protein
MKSSLCLLAGFAVTLSLGCGKSDSENFIDSFCGEVAKCCVQAALPGDGKTCHQWMALGSMGGSYNSQTGDACLAEIHSEVNAGTFCANTSMSSPSVCDSVYGSSGGNKKVGDTCDVDSDCARSSTGEVACNMSTCTALLAVGGTCSFSSDCVRSAFCDYNKNVCAARVAAGGVCTGSGSAECVDDYYCESSSKQCSAQVANGGPCTTSTMCKSGNCSNNTCQDNGGLSWICGS